MSQTPENRPELPFFRPPELMNIVPRQVGGWIWVYDGGIWLEEVDGVLKPTKDGIKQKGLSPRSLFPQLEWVLRLSEDSIGRKCLNVSPERGKEGFGALYSFDSVSARVKTNSLIKVGQVSYGWNNEQGGAVIIPVVARGGREPRLGGVLVTTPDVLKNGHFRQVIESSVK